MVCCILRRSWASQCCFGYSTLCTRAAAARPCRPTGPGNRQPSVCDVEYIPRDSLTLMCFSVSQPYPAPIFSDGLEAAVKTCRGDWNQATKTLDRNKTTIMRYQRTRPKDRASRNSIIDDKPDRSAGNVPRARRSGFDHSINCWRGSIRIVDLTHRLDPLFGKGLRA